MIKLIPDFMLKTVVLFAICLSTPVGAFADWGELFLYVGCEAKGGVFKVEPLVVWNEDLKAITPAVERNGGVIKTDGHQLYSFDARPVFNATCSIGEANLGVEYVRRSNEIRLYENNVLISSSNLHDLKRVLGFRMRYTAKEGWEEICGGRKDWRPLNNEDPIDDCVKYRPSVYDDVLAHKRSVVAIFLADPSLRLPPMTYKTISGQGEVCRLANSYLNNRFLGRGTTLDNLQDSRDGSGKLLLPERVLGEYVHPSIFDFDNDGQSDRVFSYRGEGSYILGDILYVDYNYSTNSRANLTVADVRIFPCQFDSRVPSSSECPTISQEADGAGVQVVFEGEEPVFFRGRYTNITPFNHKGETYLILKSNSGDTEYYGAVIKVHARTKYAPVCLFKRMP